MYVYIYIHIYIYIYIFLDESDHEYVSDMKRYSINQEVENMKGKPRTKIQWFDFYLYHLQHNMKR